MNVETCFPPGPEATAGIARTTCADPRLHVSPQVFARHSAMATTLDREHDQQDQATPATTPSARCSRLSPPALRRLPVVEALPIVRHRLPFPEADDHQCHPHAIGYCD